MIYYCVEIELHELEVEKGEQLREGFQGFSFGRSLRHRAKGFLRTEVGRSLYWNGAWAIFLTLFGSELGRPPKVHIM